MRLGWWTFVMLGACGGSPPPPAPAPPTPSEDAAVEGPARAADEPGPAGDSPERSRPPSTATYEQAMATPESLDVNDSRPHLNDDQLRGPMRTVNAGCPLPKNAKVTIHTAVQSGRAIGVTVDVRFEHPPPPPPKPGKPKRPTKWELQRAKADAEREAKAKKKIATCFDKAVRLIVWPPSSRRDSFTTEF